MSSYKTYILQNKSVTKWNKAKSNNNKIKFKKKLIYSKENKNLKTVSSGNHQEVVDRYQIRTVLGISEMQCSVSLQLPAQAKTAFTVSVNHDRYMLRSTQLVLQVCSPRKLKVVTVTHYICISVVRFSSFSMCNDTWIKYVIKCTYHNTAATHKNCIPFKLCTLPASLQQRERERLTDRDRQDRAR